MYLCIKFDKCQTEETNCQIHNFKDLALIKTDKMLQKLSYLNLIFAIVYLLTYLKSGTFNSTAGIFVVIVFNWLYLRAINSIIINGKSGIISHAFGVYIL